MKTAKEALLEAGRIKAITRGRISRDNHAWLKEQYDTGIRFRDWPKGEITTRTADSGEKTVTVKRDPSSYGEKVIQEFAILNPEKDYKVIGPNGKKFGMREVCNHCRVSLVQCHCGSPVILGGIPVRMVSLV